VQQKNIFGGLALVLMGVLFLLSSLGLITTSVWAVFWPLLLILLGVWFLIGNLGAARGAAESLVVPLKGVEQAHIKVEYGAGELDIRGGAAPDELLSGTFAPGAVTQEKLEGETLRLGLRAPSESFWLWGSWGSSRIWQIHLNEALPLTLNVQTGASQARLDLAALQLSKLKLQTGASETHVTLPAQAGHTQVRVETGMASVNLRVPEGVAARITAEAGLAEVKVDQRRFPRVGKGYASPDYDTAVHTVDIDIHVGMGSVTVS